ncbi:MAG: chromate transporter [Lachnospiraceae bacterium]|nr:chromate transporter [Lachnospiraceae bacterium]
MAFLELFLTFLKIGAFTFGGGYAMLPLIQEEVAAHGWLSQEALINFVAVSESTPGPFAINMATYIGAEVGGAQGTLSAFVGALCATAGVVLPSFVIILIVAKCYEKFKENRVVKGAMAGLKPAVVGLIGAAVLGVAANVFAPVGPTFAIFTELSFYISLIIFIICLVLVFKKLHPVAVICIAAAIGIACGYIFEVGG